MTKPWIGVAIGLALLMTQSSQSRPADRTPVLVELFTSEGCSSCPPADQLLIQLSEQAIPGVDVIVMSEHVDYWNYQGWKDPFSASLFTDRQSAYAAALHTDNYTPQMVVDGKAEFVGSERDQAVAAIAQAARAPKAEIALRLTSADADSVRYQVHVPAREAVDVVLAVTEDNLFSNVARGENEGRRLNHIGVVRELRILAHVPAKAPFSLASVLRLRKEWKRSDLHLVAFAQNSKTRAILSVVSVKP